MNPAARHIVLVLVAIQGCARAVTPDNLSSDLSGTYVYQISAFEGPGGGDFQPADFPTPLIDWWELTPGAEITIRQSGNALTASYQAKDGHTRSRTASLGPQNMTRKEYSWLTPLEGGTLAWHQGTLLFQQRFQAQKDMPPLTYRYRSTCFFKNSNGDLEIRGEETRQDLWFFVFPAVEHGPNYKFVLPHKVPTEP